MPKADPNWFQVGPFLPISTLSDSYAGPIVLADSSQTIQWFVKKANKDPVQHREHARDKDGAFRHSTTKEGGEGAPIMTNPRTVKPAFWAMVQVVK